MGENQGVWHVGLKAGTLKMAALPCQVSHQVYLSPSLTLSDSARYPFLISVSGALGRTPIMS